MRRALAVLLTATTVAALGCGGAEYEERLGRTINAMKNKVLMDQYLSPPVGGPFSELGITLRPLKTMSGPQAFRPGAVPPGLYDLAQSFIGPAGKADSLNLHVLARRKGGKKPDAKEAAATAARGEFASDVANTLATIYASDPPQPVKGGVSRGSNNFKFLKSNSVKVYVYEKSADKDAPGAALIWEGPGFTVLKDQINGTLEGFSMSAR